MPQPSPYWGDEADLDEQEQRPQPDVRRARAASGSRPPCGRRPIRTSARRARAIRRRSCIPLDDVRPAARRLRSEDEEAHAHQHLLRHASSDVRRGREQHAVDERRRPGRRLAEHEDVRRDARRGEVAGLDRARPRHERQRQARRVRRAEPAGRSDEGQAVRRRLLRRGAGARRIDLGIGARLPRRGRPARSRARIRRRRRWPKCTSRRSTTRRRRCRASRRAASTSIATASSGRRWRAATWRASIGASARVR